jgi:hypothetical protein
LAKYPTTYYRQAVVISNLASFNSFSATIERDDGAILYVNGREVTRFNMPGGPVTYTTYAFNADDDGRFAYGAGINRSFLVEGTNVVAVEVHQDSGDSSDLWFQMRLAGFPRLNQNVPPVVALASPTNNAYFLAPPDITITATAVDPDGTVANVEFFVDGINIGEDAATPYSVVWTNPPLGRHSIFAIATDNNGESQPSVPINIVVYESTGVPLVGITTPLDGAIIEGGTNLLLGADAIAIAGITNLQFFANNDLLGEDAASPYSLIWDAPFGTNRIMAVAYEATGISATSAVVTITVVPNTTSPAVASVLPARDAIVPALTSIAVGFSEPVQGVTANDLLVNGLPATNVLVSGSNYVFRFAQPPYGPVEVTFSAGHGITDYGYPIDLPFDELVPSARWSYVLVDRTPPLIVARSPAPNSTVSSAHQISVTFSEAVTGVDGGDLFVNDEPPLEVSGAGSNYTFTFRHQPPGPVYVTWALDHGITDIGSTPSNLFDASAGNWTFTVDASVLRFSSVLPRADGTSTALRFWAASNRTYSVLWKESLHAGRWTKLADIPAQAANRMEQVFDPLPPAYGRIYQMVSPQQPGPVNPSPAILNSPPNVIAEIGDDVTFHVMAIGNEPVTYQWRFNDSPLGSTTLNPNLATLVVTNVQFAHIGLYSVTVTDAAGSDTSTPGFLALRPKILMQPAHRSALTGQSVTFSVAAEGVGDLSYAWRRNGIRLQGQTNLTLTITGVQTEDAGSYSAVVRHQLPWGRFGVFSSNAVLSVNSP